MAAGAFQTYNKFKEYFGDNTIDLDGDSFRMTLHTSTYTFAATHSVKADLTDEVANANGYTTNGVALTGVTWTETAGTLVFDFSDPGWTAAGGSIVFRRGVVHDDTPTSPADPLCTSFLGDSTPADVTVTDGNTLTIQIHATDGMFTLSG